MSERYAEIDALLRDLYATVSGPAGPRRWSRERELFHPLARLMRTGVDEDGRPWIKIMSVSEYIADVSVFLAANDFYEVEVGRETTRFGNIAQVRSVYEARTNSHGPGSTRGPVLPRTDTGTGLSRDETDNPDARDRRGVNLIQLYDDGSRWWVLSVLWDNERDGVRVPRGWRSSTVPDESLR